VTRDACTRRASPPDNPDAGDRLELWGGDSQPANGKCSSGLTGRPFHQSEIQKKYLNPASESIGIVGGIGWLIFPAQLSQLDGFAMTDHKELMRNSNVSTGACFAHDD
jgi:hypothetical protein